MATQWTSVAIYIVYFIQLQEDSEQCEQSNDGDGNEGENVHWVRWLTEGDSFTAKWSLTTSYAIELVVKEMRLGNESAIKAGFKEKMSSIVQQDEDVLFWWSTFCAITDVDNATSEVLLPQIVILYVTIRGFAFAGR